MEPRKITLRVRSCDGLRKSCKYKTLEGARKAANKWVGTHPELGSWYAVSPDGMVTLEVEGSTLQELFPHLREEEPAPYHDW